VSGMLGWLHWMGGFTARCFGGDAKQREPPFFGKISTSFTLLMPHPSLLTWKVYFSREVCTLFALLMPHPSLLTRRCTSFKKYLTHPFDAASQAFDFKVGFCRHPPHSPPWWRVPVFSSKMYSQFSGTSGTRVRLVQGADEEGSSSSSDEDEGEEGRQGNEGAEDMEVDEVPQLTSGTGPGPPIIDEDGFQLVQSRRRGARQP
jgi:hypothetical protein